VAVAAGSVAGPARLLEYAGVELPGLRRGEAFMNAVAQSRRRIVERFAETVAYILVAWGTGIDILRRPGNQLFVGISFAGGSGISFMALGTAFLQVNIRLQTFRRNEKTLVSLRDPRRRACSTIASLARLLVEIVVVDHGLEFVRAAVAGETIVGREDTGGNTYG
jgi:hypothetical protein